MTDAMDTLSLIAPMLGVVAVIIAAYLTTKWLATRSTIKVADGKRIHVIERVPLTRDTYLALVRVRSKTYLLSVGPSHVEQIGELDGGAGAPGERRRPEDDFESLLSQRMRSFRDERPEPRRPARDERPEPRRPARDERPEPRRPARDERARSGGRR